MQAFSKCEMVLTQESIWQQNIFLLVLEDGDISKSCFTINSYKIYNVKTILYWLNKSTPEYLEKLILLLKFSSNRQLLLSYFSWIQRFVCLWSKIRQTVLALFNCLWLLKYFFVKSKPKCWIFNNFLIVIHGHHFVSSKCHGNGK